MSHQRTLIIQIHPDSNGHDDGIHEVVHQALETMGVAAQSESEVGQGWRNISVAADDPERTWSALRSLLSQDPTAFAALRRRWIVVAEGASGWADYETISHFDPTVRLTTRQARLQEIVHGELLLQCGAESCGQVFAPTLEEPASDPVEPWADRMASRALEAGWSVGKDGHARCPMHPDGESQT